MMQSVSRRWKIRIVSYVAAAILILAGCCISMFQTSLSYQRMVTNNYQRAFSQVLSSVNRIDSSMQKELYVLTPTMVATLSGEIQSEAAVAQEALSELPYANVELEQTAAFLARVGDYASALSRSVMTDGEITQEELDNLDALSLAASQLRERLENLEEQLTSGRITLSDMRAVEQRLSELTQEDAVTAGSDYEDVETNFPELPTMTYDGPFSDHLASAAPKALEGLEEVSLEEAITAAAQCADLPEDAFSLLGEVEGEIPCYNLIAELENGTMTAQVTKAGGMVLTLFQSRAVEEERLTPDECARLAWQFLERSGYTGMEETYRYDSDGSLAVNFAWRQEDVLCYPDLCSVTVAMDDGSILDFESTSYLSNHVLRELEEPAVSADQARNLLSPRLDVVREQLALIPTDGKYEVLCWEFTCEAENGQHYLVCINAATGAEQKILILLEDENGTLAV